MTPAFEAQYAARPARPTSASSGDVDDPAGAPLAHPRGNRLNDEELTLEVDRQGCVPVILGDVLQGGRALDAGVVDEHVDSAELRLGLTHHPRHGLAIRDIRLERDRARAVARGERDGLLRRVGLGAVGSAVVIDHEIRPGGGQSGDRRASDPAAGPRDQCDDVLHAAMLTGREAAVNRAESLLPPRPTPAPGKP